MNFNCGTHERGRCLAQQPDEIGLQSTGLGVDRVRRGSDLPRDLLNLGQSIQSGQSFGDALVGGGDLAGLRPRSLETLRQPELAELLRQAPRHREATTQNVSA